MRTLILFVAISVVVGSCKSAPEWQRTEAPPAASQDARSPVSAELRLLSSNDHEARLEIVVTKSIQTERDVSVQLKLPIGAAVEGNAQIAAVPTTEQGIFRRPILVRYEKIPAEDLLVVVDMQGTSFGVHAELPYRFGRPEPVIAQPPRSIEAVKLGNIDLGHPILLPPSADQQK